MPIQRSIIDNFLGGVSRVSQSQRFPSEFELMENVELDPVRGAQKRPGSEYIQGGGTEGSLAIDSPTNTLSIFWIDRGEGERFIGVIDPSASDTANTIQVFNLSGVEQTVQGDGNGDGTPTDLDQAENADLLGYLSSGSGDLRRRLRPLTVEDTTFLLNRTVVTALTGGPITYQNTGPVNVRNKSATQNVAAWSELDQPPSNIRDLAASPVPEGVPSDSNVNVLDDAFWFTQDGDIGQPSGFYAGISTTQPPWYQRVRTEGASSVVDQDTFPLRLDFNGSQFTLSFPDWSDRLSGDSTSNPGPSFIGRALSDIAFHQDRLFLMSGDNVFGTRAADILDVWINDIVITVDSDPIDRAILGNTSAIIDFAVSFQDALILMTRASRQVELRANGPLAPSTSFLSTTTSVKGVDYVRPTLMGSSMYFLGERDFANIVYQYQYDPNAFSNVAQDITERVQGYIPAECSLIVASESTEQLFLLTDAETDAVYVCMTRTSPDGQSSSRSWYKWKFDTGNEILSMHPFDDFLYMAVRRSDRVFLERIPLGDPADDTDQVRGVAQTLGYSIPIDRKVGVTGTYTAATDSTKWVLPYADATVDEIVLGPSWDQDSGTDVQRLAGLRLSPTVTVVGNTTELVVEGQFATNLNGDSAKAFAGRSYTKRIRLSEQFVRDNQGRPVHGNYQLMTAMIRHRDTGYYAVEVTAAGRSLRRHEFVVPRVGTTALDSEAIDSFGEFQTRIMSASRGVQIDIVNDSPHPSSIVEMELTGEFVPTRSPIA